jgi:prolyl-tRNA editing enzyme YbaK/EbsC (Cys-tRNA(Pro) deacylase)
MSHEAAQPLEGAGTLSASARRVQDADAAFVREVTGFAIGGIPPLGHATPLATFIDRDLLALERIWAAAGHPNALFELDPHQLVALSGGALAVVT